MRPRRKPGDGEWRLSVNDLEVLAPVVTPCSRAGEVDIDGLRSVCRYLLDAGCSAFFAAGSTGRGPWFDRRERELICREVADYVGASVVVCGGCMALGLPGMLNNAKAIADAGAQIAVITVPAYFDYSPQEIESIFLKFADSSPLPVLIYDIPAFTRTKLELGMVTRLARHGNVAGFKDSSEDFERFRELLSACGELQDFLILQGKEPLLFDSLSAGASGLVVSLLHVDPRPFVNLYRAVRKGDANQARQIQEKINELFHLMTSCIERRPETSTLFHFLNQALRQKGVCDNILLHHEGDCPSWLADAVKSALDICETAYTITAG